MPNLDWNKDTWDRSYEWTDAGDEWSGPWGSSKAEWFATILPRIGSFVPADSILEVAPGFGRWTQFLLKWTDHYCGVDLSDKCVSACRERFSNRDKAHFFLNDGMSLECVAGRQFDLIFSFDSLVHADFDVIAAYLRQIVPLLSTDGVSFVHHSNLAAVPGKSSGHRSETVSGDIVAQLVRSSGGRVLIQEQVAWEDDLLSDCYTLFCREGSFTSFDPLFFSDPKSLGLEVTSARETFQHYLKIKG
jgi:ubiquinone/menaquinone biosynthesis C-methylase UbiE